MVSYLNASKLLKSKDGHSSCIKLLFRILLESITIHEYKIEAEKFLTRAFLEVIRLYAFTIYDQKVSPKLAPFVNLFLRRSF